MSWTPALLGRGGGGGREECECRVGERCLCSTLVLMAASFSSVQNLRNHTQKSRMAAYIIILQSLGCFTQG